MRYKKLNANLGDTLRISDIMSLKFEKISEDLHPVWHEIPAIDENKIYEEGSFVEVTPDCWFVLDRGNWRMMSPHEHIEADRQNWPANQ